MCANLRTFSCHNARASPSSNKYLRSAMASGRCGQYGNTIRPDIFYDIDIWDARDMNVLGIWQTIIAEILPDCALQVWWWGMHPLTRSRLVQVPPYSLFGAHRLPAQSYLVMVGVLIYLCREIDVQLCGGTLFQNSSVHCDRRMIYTFHDNQFEYQFFMRHSYNTNHVYVYISAVRCHYNAVMFLKIFTKDTL